MPLLNGLKTPLLRVLQVLIISLSLWRPAAAPCTSTDNQGKEPYVLSIRQTLVGRVRKHTIAPKETLLDIARQYDLGFNEIQDICPRWNPWVPPVGAQMVIPSRWVIPQTLAGGILINLAELRLYWFARDGAAVMTFPVAIGDTGTVTPTGIFKISAKLTRPAWYVPPSLQHKYSLLTIPPGPDNPLGSFWLGLGQSRYGIHGSDVPWSIGRLVTNGCIRMYPEDIALLFDRVEKGTPVKIIYEPVKIGFLEDKIYVEVHKDIYGKIPNLVIYGFDFLDRKNLTHHVSARKYYQALKRRDGLPIDVSNSPKKKSPEVR